MTLRLTCPPQLHSVKRCCAAMTYGNLLAQPSRSGTNTANLRWPRPGEVTHSDIVSLYMAMAITLTEGRWMGVVRRLAPHLARMSAMAPYSIAAARGSQMSAA
jgi:hypothetical protein